MYKEFGISDEVLKLAENAENDLKDIFTVIEKMCEYNRCSNSI